MRTSDSVLRRYVMQNFGVIKLYEMDVHLMKGLGWTGNATRPEYALDAKRTGVQRIPNRV
jgi:hypothetical protein